MLRVYGVADRERRSNNKVGWGKPKLQPGHILVGSFGGRH